MRVEDLKLDELLEFRDGVIDFQGRRLVLHSTDAFAQFRKDLFEMVGPGQARRILTRFAYFWGQADAAAMRRVFKWDNVIDLIKAGPRLHALQGVARWVTKKLDVDPVAGHFEMDVAWHHSAEAEEHVAVFGRASHPSCWMLAGYASGFMSFALGHDVYFVEHSCRATGERVCTAMGKDRASWGAAINPHLPFFQAADIKGKIQSLTEVFGVDRKTMQRWGRALRSGDAEELIRVLAGRSASRKLTPAIKAFVRHRWPRLTAQGDYGSSRQLRQEIREIFQVKLSAETLRPLVQELKAETSRPTAEDKPQATAVPESLRAAGCPGDGSQGSQATSEKRETPCDCQRVEPAEAPEASASNPSGPIASPAASAATASSRCCILLAPTIGAVTHMNRATKRTWRSARSWRVWRSIPSRTSTPMSTIVDAALARKDARASADGLPRKEVMKMWKDLDMEQMAEEENRYSLPRPPEEVEQSLQRA